MLIVYIRRDTLKKRSARVSETVVLKLPLTTQYGNNREHILLYYSGRAHKKGASILRENILSLKCYPYIGKVYYIHISIILRYNLGIQQLSQPDRSLNVNCR